MRIPQRFLFHLAFAAAILLGHGAAVEAQAQKSPHLEDPGESSESRKPDDNPINGRWVAQVNDQQFVLEVAVYEGDLLGTVTLPGGEKVPLTLGVCVTDEFSFTTLENGVEWDWEGIVTESELQGERQRFDTDETVEFTAKRAGK